MDEKGKIIGFIGLGAMGNPMSRRLLAAGYAVWVFDKKKEAVAALLQEGAKEAQSPLEMAERVKCLITMLPDSPAVEEVVLGPLGIANRFPRKAF